jgi:circadian clock protein KaiC
VTRTAAQAPERVQFGIRGLDDVLFGGVVRHNNILLDGPPGAGKTTLALAFAYAGAHDFDEPALVVSFELTPDKLLRDVAGFGWDFETLERQGKIRLIQTSPNVLLEDLRLEDGVLASQLRQLGARRLVIDGLTPLRLLAEQSSELRFRECLQLLVEGFARLGVTTLVTSEVEPAGPNAICHERYVFDTVISLDRSERNRHSRRTIEVVKARGQDFVAGRHTLQLETNRGVAVYRRTQSHPKTFPAHSASTERHTFCAPAIDELFGGGVYAGSITLVTGISGTGKTVAGLQFLAAGAALGQRGLIVSLDEHPEQLLRNATSVGLPLDRLIDEEKVHVLYDSPLELELDVHFDRIASLVKAHDIKRIVFDSLAVYEKTSREEATDFMYALAAFCRTREAIVVFNYESPELLGISQISERFQASHLVDNIVLLNYVEVSTTLRRAITVPKARGSKNIQITREYVIGRGGIALIAEPDVKDDDTQAVPQLPFSSYYGLLARAPARRSPVIDEAVMNGQRMPDSATLIKE